MTVFDETACLGNHRHALCPEGIEFCKWSRLMVSLLVCSREELFLFSDDIILELAHGVKSHSGRFAECIGSLDDGLVWIALERTAILVEE